MFKRYSQFSGGTCDPLVIHWPKGIKAKGEVRQQYHIRTDIVPTILDVVGLEMPKVYRGVEAVSAERRLDALQLRRREAPRRQKEVQYYAMLGTRGLWKDGWKAAALHAPISGVGHFDQDRWELYHVDADRSESKDLAKKNPEKLKELIDAWFKEADEELCAAARRSRRRSSCSRSSIRRRSRLARATSTIPTRRRFPSRWRRTSAVARTRSSPTSNLTSDSTRRDFRARVALRRSRAVHQGPPLYYVYNFLGSSPSRSSCPKDLSPGKHTLGMAFVAREVRQVWRVDRQGTVVRRRPGGGARAR